MINQFNARYFCGDVVMIMREHDEYHIKPMELLYATEHQMPLSEDKDNFVWVQNGFDKVPILKSDVLIYKRPLSNKIKSFFNI